MNSFYPKRLINFISICLLVLGVIVNINLIDHLNSNFENLTETDRNISFLSIGFIFFYLLSCIGALKKKVWSWIGITSYLILCSCDFIFGEHGFIIDLHLITLSLAFVFLALVVFFFFSKDVIHYFKVRAIHIAFVTILSSLLYYLISQSPNHNRNVVNSYYIEIIDNQIYLNDTLYSGTLVSNHPNGQMKFKGNVSNGYEDGTWNYFYSNGIIKKIINFNIGTPEGKVINYYSTGEQREIMHYFQGKLHGQYELWYSKNEIHITGNYVNGFKQGDWKEYENGILKIEKYNLDTLKQTEYFEENQLE